MPVLLDRADGKSGLVQLLLLAAREIIEAVHGHLRWCEGVHCRAMWDADRVTAPSISLSFINMRKASASLGSSITTLVPPETSVSTADTRNACLAHVALMTSMATLTLTTLPMPRPLPRRAGTG